MDRPQRQDEVRMSLGEHLDELRKRIIYSLGGLCVAMAVGLALAGPAIHWLEGPYLAANKDAPSAHLTGGQLTVLSVAGAFSMYMKVGLYLGLVLSSWWLAYQLWAFVGAGLYERERRYVMRAVPWSAGLFVAGAAFFMIVVIGPALKFFREFNGWLGVMSLVTLEDYVDFVVTMLLVFGIAFQTPLVVLVLSKVGLVSFKTLNHYRKHVIFGMTVFAGIFAPSDLWSMVVMGGAMWLLYEAGVLLSWLIVFRKQRAQGADEGQGFGAN
jgi:sec-independent protein translocase protein TatC